MREAKRVKMKNLSTTIPVNHSRHGEDSTGKQRGRLVKSTFDSFIEIAKKVDMQAVTKPN